MMRDSSETSTSLQKRKTFRGFVRNEEGVTAVEFALVALPFFIFVFSVIELGVSFTAQQILSNATEDLSREFYTGRKKQENAKPDEIRAAICNKIQFMVTAGCPGLYINLDNYENFAEVPVKNLVTSTGHLGVPSRINLGGPLTINQINVLYRRPVITNIMYLIDPKMKPEDNILPLFSTTTWQNEPFY